MRTKIKAFYTPDQVLQENIALSVSKSPLKPKLVMEDLLKIASSFVEVNSDFPPFVKEDFCIAHTQSYVESVFHFNKPGVKLSSDIPWSEELVKTLTYTSSSLYHAIKNSLENPSELSFSPTSGFHHAMPHKGIGFCTFAGQVISSTKIFKESGKKGCYLDLDGHFGNSIEDCRGYVPELNEAVPEWANFNPGGYDKNYTYHLEQFLYGKLKSEIIKGNIDYVVWCHGADSHIDDDFGGQVDTKYWELASHIFWTWVKHMDEVLERPLPVSFSLFGGYRRNAYQSVINLHISDIVKGLNILLNANIDYKLEYVTKSFKEL